MSERYPSVHAMKARDKTSGEWKHWTYQQFQEEVTVRHIFYRNVLYLVILDCFKSFYRNGPAPASLSGNHRVKLSTVGHCKFGGYKCRVSSSSTLSTYFSIIIELSGISAGICSGMSGEDIARICIDCKADIIVVEHEALLKKVICILSPL